jgi:hypothetical protein
VAGQALSPGRQLRAIIAYRRSPKAWQLGAPDDRGLVLVHAPELAPDDADAQRVGTLLAATPGPESL